MLSAPTSTQLTASGDGCEVGCAGGAMGVPWTHWVSHCGAGCPMVVPGVHGATGCPITVPIDPVSPLPPPNPGMFPRCSAAARRRHNHERRGEKGSGIPGMGTPGTGRSHWGPREEPVPGLPPSPGAAWGRFLLSYPLGAEPSPVLASSSCREQSGPQCPAQGDSPCPGPALMLLQARMLLEFLALSSS